WGSFSRRSRSRSDGGSRSRSSRPEPPSTKGSRSVSSRRPAARGGATPPASAAARDERLSIRFLKEARAAARLNHPGIVRVYTSGRAQGVLYFAMEMIDGRSLADLAGAGPMDPDDAARIAAQVARALDHAHRSGLVHRDVK